MGLSSMRSAIRMEFSIQRSFFGFPSQALRSSLYWEDWLCFVAVDRIFHLQPPGRAAPPGAFL